jgi:hypothetical protein
MADAILEGKEILAEEQQAETDKEEPVEGVEVETSEEEMEAPAEEAEVSEEEAEPSDKAAQSEKITKEETQEASS